MAVSRNKTRKSQKDAWEWINSVHPDEIGLEHLERAYRIHSTCSDKNTHRSNCKSNPNCFNCLGERFWLKEIKDETWCNGIVDPYEHRRVEGMFVGLKNLGATCYVNTLVQLWFHNEEFRSALYSWIPFEFNVGLSQKEDDQVVAMETNDKTESTQLKCDVKVDIKTENKKCDDNECGATDIVCPPIPLCKPWENSKKPQSFCQHLQLLLAQLQYTARRFVDPAPFVESLGLNTELQQDAQEFSKLFMSLLEDTLSQQPNPLVRNIVQQQFGGSYSYITRCCQCGRQSQRSSRFYELDLNIQGNTNLAQCIREFLKEENLDGDNQYYCSHCMNKQDATRYIKLQELPPVLNLQLLRFVYDRKSGCKKKLNTVIWFPEVLDMKEYVDAKIEGRVYDLTAVLIHRGLSAYSGHYIAHIKDKKSGDWYRFNDELTEKMKGRSLNLDSEEDLHDIINGCANAKKPKLSKAGSSSKDAYMLVYRQRGEEKQAIAQEPPADIQMLVAEDNSKIEEWIKDVKDIRDRRICFGKSKQAEVQNVLKMLPVKEGEKNYDWISSDWLRTWLSNDQKQQPGCIDNYSLLCQHGKLHPDKVLCAKRISTKAASLLFKVHNGSPRLNSDSFCLKCVRERCRSLQFSSRMCKDQKFFGKALKAACEERGFWVSRKSLQKWKVLAQNCSGNLTTSDLTRPHDVSTSDLRTPAEETEMKLTTVFDACKRSQASTYDGNSTVADMDTECKSGVSRLDVGSSGVSRLDVGSSGVSRLDLGSGRCEDRENFNEDILCEHGNLSTLTASRRLVSEEVWERLRFYFSNSPEFSWDQSACSICSYRDKEVEKRLEDLKQLASQQRSLLGDLFNEKERPDFKAKESVTAFALSRNFYDNWKRFIRSMSSRRVRPSCITNKILMCPHERFLYHPQCNDVDGASSALVYLWTVEWEVLSQTFGYDIEIKLVQNIFEGQSLYTITPDCCAECNASLIAENSCDNEVYEYAKIYVRKITKDHSEEDIQNILENHSPIENNHEDCEQVLSSYQNGNTSSKDYRRRSSRHRKQRGEVMIMVDSSETVRDVKLELMKQFSAMPLDQHLSMNGRMLEDDMTLGVAGVRPGSILLLKVDEPEEGRAQEEIARVSREPEQGFKGTSLLNQQLAI